jgi:parallel beta-helix repeat protein
MFVCWRVQRGLFEDNELANNRGAGISIGHKDSDNLFRGNRMLENRGPGLEFRGETEAMGAHRNVFECNTILDNGAEDGAVVIRGRHDDLVFRGNTMGWTKSRDRAAPAIATEGQARRIVAEKNELKNAAGEIGQLR